MNESGAVVKVEVQLQGKNQGIVRVLTKFQDELHQWPT